LVGLGLVLEVARFAGFARFVVVCVAEGGLWDYGRKYERERA
jgi:hypothetical protein